MSSLTEVLDQAPERARAEDRRESPQNHREEMGANTGENACEDARGDAAEDFPKEPEETEDTEPSGLKRAWTASRKRIGRWTRDSAHFRILV